MKLQSLISLFLLAPFASCQQHRQSSSSSSPASGDGDALTTLAATLPPCAIECLAPLVKDSTCAMTDIKCMCKSKQFIEAATVCVRAKCKLSEALTTKNLTAVACGAPVRNKSAKYTAMNITTGTLTVILAVSRLIFKQFFSMNSTVGADDIIIFVCVLIGIPGILINQFGLVGHGLGRDIWTLHVYDLEKFAEYFFFMEIIYLTEISLMKLSLSLFYVHVFPGGRIRRLLQATAVFNVCFGVVFVLASIFQCSPINYSWRQYQDTPPHGHCFNMNAFAWSNSAVSLSIDVWMIILPISQIRKLELNWRKKVGVSFMFLIGTFVTVISLLRLRSVIHFANIINPTWDQWEVAYWSTMEVNIGIICTCLPTVRAILARMFPSYFSTNDGRSVIRSNHTGTRLREARELCSLETTSEGTVVTDEAVHYVYENKGVEKSLDAV